MVCRMIRGYSAAPLAPAQAEPRRLVALQCCRGGCLLLQPQRGWRALPRRPANRGAVTASGRCKTCCLLLSNAQLHRLPGGPQPLVHHPTSVKQVRLRLQRDSGVGKAIPSGITPANHTEIHGGRCALPACVCLSCLTTCLSTRRFVAISCDILVCRSLGRTLRQEAPSRHLAASFVSPSSDVPLTVL